MDEYRASIPDEHLSTLTFRQKERPGVAVINDALCNFEPKIVFAWHLSIMVHFEDLIENGMPSHAERELVDPFCDELNARIKGPEKRRPNALFLARITWRATRELIWRVYVPQVVDGYLKSVLRKKSYPRPFDYMMEHDPEWEKAAWHLSMADDHAEDSASE